MKVSEIMTPDVHVCVPGASLERAARIMWDEDCGCVPVIDGEGRPLGLITDRDVCMGTLARGGALGDAPVDASMSQPPVTCKADDTVEEAERIMCEHQIRRLIVVDDDGKLAGLVSLSDLVQAVPSEGQAEALRFSDELLTTLSSVTRPRRHEEVAIATEV